MAAAAHAFVASLDEAQRRVACRSFADTAERRRWFYTPTDHGGLPLLAMRPRQQQLAMRLLATGLSRPGYTAATTIMGLENVLDLVEGWQRHWGRERGRDPQLYYVTVFGDPADPDAPWSWRFGGHHVSVHHVVHGDEVLATTPCFLGADPAESRLLGGHILRPLGAVEDLARDLVRNLDEGQRAVAVIDPSAPVDIVGGNRSTLREGDTVPPLAEVWRGHFDDPDLRRLVETLHEAAEASAGVTPEHLDAVSLTARPKGLSAAAMSDEQRDQLRAVLGVFTEQVPDEIAAREAEKFAGEKILQVHFAWAGGIERGEPHYYRLQASRLLAEYDNTQRDVNHIHAVWRDPANDFGGDPLSDHLRAHHGSDAIIATPGTPS
ncbi:MAG: DUF3500 domain-containing protein [Nocardioidaceae bacterium]|nr:DUF3500 domain-containing protein [Nocardioidaceae bacterium]